MICEQCQKEGLKSKVHEGMSWITAVYSPPFYDEEGKYHHHDYNTTTREFRCSNGHEFNKCSSGNCWCGWGKE